MGLAGQTSHYLASYPGSSEWGERRALYALLACAHLPQLSRVLDIFRARPYYDDIRVYGRGDDTLRVYIMYVYRVCAS